MTRARLSAALASSVLALAVATGAVVAAADRPPEENTADGADPALPSPADLMQLTQLRHFKMWFAVRAGNWALADYELTQFVRTVERITALYPGLVPAEASDAVGGEAAPLRRAIAAEDGDAFAAAFRALTDRCNACHGASGLDFIHVRVPTSSPFSNQDMHVPQ